MDIIGVGDSGVDVMLAIEAMPKRGNKSRARELAKSPGGMIGNFCSATAKLGMKCGVVSAIGDDEYGALLTADYRRNGVDISNLVVIPGSPTFYAVVLLDRQGEKYLFTVDTPLLSPPLEQIDFAYLGTAKYVHLNSMDHRLAEYVTAKLRGSVARVSLDYEIHADKPGIGNWQSVFKNVSILFINQTGIASLLGTNLDQAADFLLSSGIVTVVVTCAEKGGYVFSQQERFHYQAFPVDKVADATGAGDCFNAAFCPPASEAMICAAARTLALQRQR